MIAAISKSNGCLFVQPLKLDTKLNLFGDTTGFNEAVFGKVLTADVRTDVFKEGDIVIYQRSSEQEVTMNGTTMFYVPSTHILAIANGEMKFLNRR